MSTIEPLINCIFSGAMSRDSDAFHTFYYAQLDVIIEVLSSWPDFVHYARKLRRLRNDIVEKGCQMFDPNPNHFNTLNHGDFWLNNVMIKHQTNTNLDDNDRSTFENVVFIDFQDSCWASPAIDLHYFLNTSLCESLRPNSFNELVSFYHVHLAAALERLRYQQHIPTKDEFLAQFNARNFYGMKIFCQRFFLEFPDFYSHQMFSLQQVSLHHALFSHS